VPSSAGSSSPGSFSEGSTPLPGNDGGLVATRYIAQFVSPFSDDSAIAVDGLAIDWTGQDLYAYPPTVIIPLILQRLEAVQCSMTLVAPLT
jgi:hypothetical protein